MGAAGRDFHNFNTVFRNNKAYKVVCFTAAQIPGISGRRYPKELAGKGYPNGIPIYDEAKLPELIKKFKADEVVLAYSDLSHQEVMEKASIILAAGGNFVLLSPKDTMLKSKKPVVSVCAVRTGCGKSQTTRYIAKALKGRVVIVRHPMPYGNLLKQRVQRFSKTSDLTTCTIEEREEYEPLINLGFVVYAGVDYHAILKRAEKEADVIIWDGGNNDTPFFVPDLHIVVVDPHRPGHELTYYPGLVNLRMADIVVVNKVNTAKQKDIKTVIENIKRVNPKAKIIKAESKITVHTKRSLKNKRVLVIEDGPTLTHGGMKYGAGFVIAKQKGAKIVDPKKYAVGSIKQAYQTYDIGPVLPALGYSKKQIKELEKTINKVPCDYIVDATPANIQRLIKVNKQVINVTYELKSRDLISSLRVLSRALQPIARPR